MANQDPAESTPEQGFGGTIHLELVFHTARAGIYRAWMFMGYGINAASDQNLTYEVPEASHLKLVESLPADQIQMSKEAFAAWVTGNGLREIIEAFDACMDQVFNVVLLIEAWKKKSTVDETRLSEFQELGTERKLQTLGQYDIQCDFSKDIISVKKARNCLTHRLGLVQQRDINAESGLRVQWRTLELYGYHEDGTEYIPDLEQLKSGPIKFPRRSPVKQRNALRSKTFKVGERVKFTPREIKELCFWFLLLLQDIEKSVVEYGKKQGVGIMQPTQPSTEKG